MSFMPAVRASLAERFIFSFRLPAKALARYLPVSWLAPQEVRGYGVASFCILDLRGITVAPLTTQIGLTSISCAPRYAVLDLSLSRRLQLSLSASGRPTLPLVLGLPQWDFRLLILKSRLLLVIRTTELCCASKAWTTDCSLPRPSALPQKRNRRCSRRHRSLLISSRRASAATGVPGMVHV